MIIEGAYGYHRHQWELLVGRRRSLDWSDSCYHVALTWMLMKAYHSLAAGLFL